MTGGGGIAPEAAGRYKDAVGRLDCDLRVGRFYRVPLPRSLAELRSRLEHLYQPLLEQFPEAVDAGIRFVFRDGSELVAAGPFNGVRRSDGPERFIPADATPQQRRGAQLLVDGLELAEATWLDRKRATWRAARSAERVAVEMLLMQLHQSRRLADEAERRYVGNPRAATWRIDLYGPEFDALRQALLKLARARADADVDLLRKQRTVMQMAALGAMALSMMQVNHVAGGVKEAFAEVEGLANDTTMRAAQANIAYLVKMRELAKDHPILVPLQHYTEKLRRDGRPSSYTVSALQGDIRDAIANARKAIAELQRIAGMPVVPVPEDGSADGETWADQVTTAMGNEPPTIAGIVAAVADAEVTTVWKLPFFLDRAVEFLLPAQRRDVLAIQRAAEKHAKAEAFSQAFATVGCEAIAAIAPAAGPVGVVIAVAWGLVSLTQSIKQYHEVSLLYDATIDPSVLLLGREHDPADPSAVIMDLVGLLPL